MQPCELAAFVTSVACALAKNSTDDELTIMSAIFSQLGDTLTTIQAQNNICNKIPQNDSDENDSNLSSQDL